MVVVMSELRTKIAAGVTILAVAGLGGLAWTHPQAPPPGTQVQSASKTAKHVSVPATSAKTYDGEREGFDD
jgi:hypothetical protein